MTHTAGPSSAPEHSGVAMRDGNRAARFAGAGGVLAAIFAALCCAGGPLIAGVIASIGLSFIRKDAILLPLLAIALIAALWGFSVRRRIHHSAAPLFLAVFGGASLLGGVFIARWLLAVGTALLIVATIWDLTARRHATAVASR